MAPDNGVNQTLPSDPEQERPFSPERLDSWKEIAAYLKRSVRTVRRWEAEEGLPVHRHLHQSSGSVYAFGPELDAWLLSRRPEAACVSPSLEERVEADVPVNFISGLRRGGVALGTIALTAFVVTLGVWRVRSVNDTGARAIHSANPRTGQTEAASKSVNFEALDLISRCLVRASSETTEAMRDAITLCQKAIDKQPDYAPAYARLALYQLQLPFGGRSAPKESVAAAEANARKAVHLQDNLAEGHRVLANVLFRVKWDWAGSEREFRRALELEPDSAEAHRGFSAFLAAMGRYQEAIQEAKRARDLDPLTLQPVLSLGMAYRAAGDYESAIGVFRQGLDKDPHHRRTHFNLGVTYLQKGMLDDAIDVLETAVRSARDNTRVIGYLAYAYGLAGRRTAARERLEALLAIADRQYVSPLAIARIYTGLGNTDDGLGWLEKAYATRDIDFVAPATNPDLADLREKPQYRKFFDRIRANH